MAPTAWKDSSMTLVARAKDFTNQSLDLRAAVEVVLKKTKDAVKASAELSKVTLHKKVNTTAALHQKLSKHKMDLNDEIQQLQMQREKLLSELADKSVPLDMVSKRLDLRKTRPPREQVRDEVEEALEDEYKKLIAVITKLEKKLASVDAELDRLTALTVAVSLDIDDKSLAMTLDRKCVDLQSMSGTSSVVSLKLTPRTPTRGQSRGSSVVVSHK